VWKDYVRQQGEQPVDLVARRQREVPLRTRPLEGLSAEQLHRRMFDRSPLVQLAACSERARRAGSVKDLVAQLETWDSISRYFAARALGERRAAEAIPALLGVVFSQHEVAAVEALGQIGDARVLEPLLVLYEHWSGRASFLAALERVIAQFGDVAIERIEQLHAEGRLSLVRAGAAIGLSRSTRAVQFLARHMREERNPLMNLLARMGDEARGLLFAVANGEHETWLVRYYAARELARAAGVFQDEAGRIVAALTESSKERGLRCRVAWFTTGNYKTEVADPIAAVLDVLRHSDAEAAAVRGGSAVGARSLGRA
jgi:HEAT repeat protein